MNGMLVYPVGSTPACRYAAAFLAKAEIALVDHPTPDATHLLLDVPSFKPDGSLRGGGEIREVLRMLPAGITVVGGNLNSQDLRNHRTMDLLRDAQYLSANAAITADCALRVAAGPLCTTFSDSPALILGWGRIGKCLAQLLKTIGTEVTIAARKETDRAMAAALGYRAIDIPHIRSQLPGCRLVFNTVPESVLSEADTAANAHCLYIDLASKRGILGDGVIEARGLPGIHTPESSGKLICETILRLSREGSS